MKFEIKIEFKLFIYQITGLILIQLKIFEANDKLEKYTNFIAFRSLEKEYINEIVLQLKFYKFIQTV